MFPVIDKSGYHSLKLITLVTSHLFDFFHKNWFVFHYIYPITSTYKREVIWSKLEALHVTECIARLFDETRNHWVRREGDAVAVNILT